MTQKTISRLIKITQAQLDDIVRKHDMFLHARVGGACAQLAKHDLSGLSLENCDLSNADMTGVSLNGTLLAGANLDFCNLFGADLRFANLQGASLKRADMRGVCLRGAHLVGADMTGVDLREGHLASTGENGDYVVLHDEWPVAEGSGADLSGCNLTDARLSGVVANGANFSDALLRGCKMVRANLNNANFAGANLEGADLSHCELEGVNMRGTVLVNTSIDTSKMNKANLAGVMTGDPMGPTVRNLPYPIEDMMRRHAQWINSAGAEGARLDISGYDMRGVNIFNHRLLSLLKANDAILYGLTMIDVQLQAAQLCNANMRYVQAPKADMRGVDLSGAQLVNADFRMARFDPLISVQGHILFSNFANANLRYINLSGANLRRARLVGADLSYANLLDVNLTGADLTGAILTGAHLNENQKILISNQQARG